VNAELKVASLQESVTVTGQSPVVDTSATQIGNTFSARKQRLGAADLARLDFSLLARQSPGRFRCRALTVGG
jgi:hypothetical protein